MFNQDSKHKDLSKGFSLVEMLVYMAVLSMILILVVASLVFVMNSIKEIQASKAIENSAIVSLERISREIRNAVSVETLSSDILILESKDDNSFQFSVENGVLVLTEDGASKGPLTSSEAEVSNLNFFIIDGGAGQEAVRVEVTIEAGVGDHQKERTFYNTTVLR